MPGRLLRAAVVLGVVVWAMAWPALIMRCEACVGARALAMGGAFVAVADDAEAVYWNPAGLGKSPRFEMTFTHTLNNRDLFNYDEFLALTVPLGTNGAGGVSWIKESYYAASRRGQADGGGPAGFEGNWIACSYGMKAGHNLSVGTTLRYEVYALVPPEGTALAGTRWAMDLGVIYSASPSFSIGALFQDMNGSPIFWKDGLVSWVAPNFRPGMSYRFKSGDIITLDIYDLTGEIPGQRALRIGYETHIAGVALRLGYYGLGNGRAAPTVGLGYSKSRVRADYVFLGRGLREGDPGLGGTHQLGLSVTL